MYLRSVFSRCANIKLFAHLGLFLALIATGIFFLPYGVAHAAGTTYYIDNSSGSNCSDSGNGQSQPWCNVSAANSHGNFSAGDQILLKAGDVWNNEQLAPQGSGTSSTPITINSYGSGSKPQINGDGNYQGVVALNNQSYWLIENLEVTDQSSTYAYGRAGVYVTAPSGGSIVGITIQNMLIHDVTGYKATADDGQADATGGIIINGYNTAPNGITITNNTVHDVGLSGIWVYGAQSTGARATNVTVSYNTVYNVGGQGIWFHTVSGAQVTHNVVHNTGTYNVGGTVAIWDFSSDHDVFAYNEAYDTVGNNDGEAFDCDGGVQDSIYEYNYSHDNPSGFFTWYNTDGQNSGCIVRYNISQNDGRSIFNDVGAANSSQIYNNTIYIPSGSTTTISDGTFNNTNSFNNNIFDNQGSASSWTENNQAVGGVWDHNTIYGDQPANEPGGYEPYENPQFVNPGGAGTGISTASAYKLQSSSPDINAGVNISNNGGQDFFGNSVCANGGPNIGADNSYNGCPSSGSTAPANGTYEIENNANSGEYLALDGNVTTDGTQADVWHQVNAVTQYWVLTSVGNGQYTIQSGTSGEYLALDGNVATDGTHADVWHWVNAVTQYWTISSAGNGQYTIENATTGEYLALDGNVASDGTQVDVWHWVGAVTQYWTLLPQ